MKFRTVLTNKEQLSAIELSKSVFKENMAEQFTLLFDETNWNHMFIAIDESEIVSLVNYYPSFVRIGECLIKIASIGSVCTKPDFRGQKLATRLLKLAEQQMLKEDIDLVVISGSGGLYTDFGASLAGNVYEYCIENAQLLDSEDIKIVLYDKSKLDDLVLIQNQEDIRYLRSRSEFDVLLTAQTYPDTFASYPIYLVEKENQSVAYIVGFLPIEGQEFGIKEFAGDRNSIVKAFKLLTKIHHRDKIHFAADGHDSINDLINHQNRKLIHQYASFRIMDFVDFMNKLKPYFDLVYPNNEVAFQYINQKPTFSLKNEKFILDSSNLLSQLILGYNQPLDINIDNYPNIKRFFEKVFPIPFVWTNNLNYQ